MLVAAGLAVANLSSAPSARRASSPTPRSWPRPPPGSVEGVPAPDLDSRRGILNPDAAERHFRLTRYPPSEDLAHLIDRHWVVEWDLRRAVHAGDRHPPERQPRARTRTRDLSTASSPAASGRQLAGRGKVVATKFRPGGFHPLHPVPAHTLTDRMIDGRRLRAVRASPATSASRSRDGGRAARARLRGRPARGRDRRAVRGDAGRRRRPPSRSCARTPATPSARCSGSSASTWA